MTAPAELAADPSNPQPVTEKPGWQRALPWLLAYGVFRIALGAIQLPASTPPSTLRGIAFGIALVVICLASVSLYTLVTGRMTGRTALGLFATGLVLWLLRQGLAWLVGSRTWIPPVWVGHLVGGLSDVGIICLGAGIGAGLAGLIRDRNILLPAGVFAAFADYFMVRYGTVRMALNAGAPGAKVIAAMSAHVPMPHVRLPDLSMGMADFVFLAFFLACAQRFGMNTRGTLVVLVVLLTLLLFSIGMGLLGPFPAVAPMALGFVLVNLRYFKLTRAEIHATLLVFVMMAGLTAAFYFFVR